MTGCAIVTGSSSGIGREIAVRLAADGFPVLLADIRRDPLTGGTPTDEEIGAQGGTCEFIRADVSSRPDCEHLVELAAQYYGRLGEPTDVAAAVAFLASDQATYISGVNLMVDGGWMAY